MCPKISSRRPAAIREARAAAGLTQQALAERARCSMAYVQFIEAGYVPGNIEASPTYRRVFDVLNNDDERRPVPAGAREDGGAAPHGSG